MRFEDERYVKLFTRDTVTWKLLSWPARAVLTFMIRKADRSGVIDVGDDGILGLAVIIDVQDIAVVTDAIDQLIARGTVVRTEMAFVLPRFLEAQDAVQSDKVRAKEYRERERAKALGIVTPRDAAVTLRDGSSRKAPRSSLQLSQPSLPSVPALAEPRKKLKKKLAVSSPPTPGGLKPPAGGKAEAEAQRRIAAGELTSAQVAASIAKFERNGRTYNGDGHRDAAKAVWIKNEDPNRTNGEAAHVPTDDEYLVPL